METQNNLGRKGAGGTDSRGAVLNHRKPKGGRGKNGRLRSTVLEGSGAFACMSDEIQRSVLESGGPPSEGPLSAYSSSN